MIVSASDIAAEIAAQTPETQRAARARRREAAQDYVGRSVNEVGAPLSDREHEVLRHAADGLSSEQIGRKIHLSRATVVQHLRTAKLKLGAANLTHAVAIALRRKLFA